MNHGVIFNSGSAKVCSPAIFEICFCYDKDIWIAATDYYILLYNCAISIDSYSPVNKFYRFIIFGLLFNGVILLFNCLVLILYLKSLHTFFSLRHYFLYLNIIWTFI